MRSRSFTRAPVVGEFTKTAVESVHTSTAVASGGKRAHGPGVHGAGLRHTRAGRVAPEHPQNAEAVTAGNAGVP